MAEIKITTQNFEEEVLKSDIPVLVDFWATWCGPCKMLAPVLAEIAEEYKGKIKVGKINVDEEPDLAVKYHVMNIPMLLLFKDGERAKQTIGYKTKEQLVEFLK